MPGPARSREGAFLESWCYRFRIRSGLLSTVFLKQLCTPHENSLHLAILSPGDGRAGRASRRIVATLGQPGPRRYCVDRIPKSSYGSRATRIPRSVQALGRARAHRRCECSSHLASSFSEPKSIRANSELQFFLCLGREYGSFLVLPRCGDCELATVVGWTLR